MRTLTTSGSATGRPGDDLYSTLPCLPSLVTRRYEGQRRRETNESLTQNADDVLMVGAVRLDQSFLLFQYLA